jgi:hypothetical protein
MSIGPSEILFVGIIILVLIFMSRGRKARQIKKQQEAEALRASPPTKESIKYPQLQLLGFAVMLAGLGLAGIGYLMTRGVLDEFSIAGILVVVLGMIFIILARQKSTPATSTQKVSTQPVSRSSAIKQQTHKNNSTIASIDPRIKPEDVADYKKYMALKAKAADVSIKQEDSPDFKKYMALKAKTVEKS